MRRLTGLPLLFGLALGAGGCDENLGLGTSPRIRVIPVRHAFAAVAIGEQDQVRVTVTNIGGGKLNVTSVEMASGSSTDFSIPQPPAMPRVLNSNQSFAFDVVYRPSDALPDSGRIVIRSDDPAAPAVNVELTTLEIGPDIAVEPEILDFGVVARGQSSTLEARIKNEGFADLTIENILTVSGGPYTVQEPTTFPLTLAPGATTPLRVTYAPTGCAANEEQAQIFSNDLDESPFAVTLRGRPPGPAITADPPAVDFGAVTVGQTVSQTVTLRSTGTVDLQIQGIALGVGTDPAFTIQTSQTQITVPAGGSHDVTVSVRASQAGIVRGTLVVTSDDCDNRQLQIPLEAIGTEGPAALVQLSPASLNFGNVAQGAAGERTFDVVSIGSLPLMVSGVSLEAGSSNEFSVAAGGGSFQLAACTGPPCPSRTVTVRYSPVDQGADSGNIVVASNAANDPMAKVAVTGNGTAGATCRIRVSPGILNFRSVTLGSYKDLPLTLTNTGTGNCTYDRTDISPFPPFHGFRVQSQPGIGSVIGPGQSRQVVIRFAPPSLGEKFTSAHPHWNDPNPGGQPGETLVPLLGFSVEADIAVVPGSVDFGIITVGCASQIQTVTVFNNGSADLIINSVRLQNSPSRFQIIQAPAQGTVVPGGSSIPIRLRYVPNAPGVSTDTLIIETNDSDEPTTSVPLRGEGTVIVDVIDKFTQATQPQVDILFVVDNSGSMSEEQANLRRNFRDFANFAQTLNVSYQIGVVTTDNGKLRGNPKIIRPTDADPVGEFDRNANVGTNGSGTERGLEFALQALSAPLINSDNAGFLRRDASLEVIVVSDEEDQSPQSIDYYVTALYAIKGAANTSLFRLSAIVGDVPNGCTSPNGDAEAGMRYVEVANRTGGTVGSICDASFAQSLRSIGSRAFALRVQFFLSRQPDLNQPFSVRTYATEAACDADPNATGGTVVPANPNTGYTYDAQSNSIIFGPQAVPPRGSCIKVKYRAACIPP